MSSTPRTNKTAPNVELRHVLKPSDLENITALVRATKMFSPAEVDVAVELVREHLARGDASGYWFTVAEEAGELVGYAAYGPIACTVSSFDLYWIAVQPARQSRGIGKVLLRCAEERIRAAGGTRAYVDTSGRQAYTPTRGFYERSGYRREAVFEDFYAAGDPKVVYSKSLHGNSPTS